MKWEQFSSQLAYLKGTVLQPEGRDCGSKMDDAAQQEFYEKIWGVCLPISWDGVEEEVRARIVDQCLGREDIVAALRLLPLGKRRWGLRLHRIGELNPSVKIVDYESFEEADEGLKSWWRTLRCGVVPHPGIGKEEHPDDICQNY